MTIPQHSPWPEPEIHLRNWPEPETITQTIKEALKQLYLYDHTITYKTTTGIDSWTIEDPNPKSPTLGDIISITIDDTLRLTVNPTQNHPTIDYVCCKILFALSQRTDTISKITDIIPDSYFQYCIHFRNIGPDITQAQHRLSLERKNNPHQGLDIIYRGIK